MIDLKRKRNLEPIAHKWLGWVKHYITDIHTRGFLPSEIIGGYKFDFQSHAEKIKFLCRRKVFECGETKIERRYYFKILDVLWINFDSLILASPSQIRDVTTKWQNRKARAWLFVKGLADILLPYYDKVANKYGGQLVDELGVKTCPYCNRQFIHSFTGIRKERPELDHFFPKREYPIFCLSFYNLIPACHACNHEKLIDELSVNPYERGFNSAFIITDKKGVKLSKSKIYRLTEKEIQVRFENPSNNEKTNIATLGLENVYNKHTDYVKELISKSMAYDEYAREALVSAFQGAGHHPRQVYDFVWGRHLADAEYEDRPLSKLTKDILELLDIRK